MNQGDKPITAEESPALVAEAEAILTDTSWLGLMSVNDIVVDAPPAVLLEMRVAGEITAEVFLREFNRKLSEWRRFIQACERGHPPSLRWRDCQNGEDEE